MGKLLYERKHGGHPTPNVAVLPSRSVRPGRAKKKPASRKRAESISLEENRGDRKHDAASPQIYPIYISNDRHQ
jgi:hypothetical protein